MSAVERLAEIQARLDAATPGPWEVTDPHPFLPGASLRLYGSGWMPIFVQRATERHVEVSPDGRFIAAARSDVPALVAALRAVIEDCNYVLRDPKTFDHRISAQARVTLDLIEEHLGGAE